jgi:D-amino-acid dehydrogenase
MPAPSQTRTGPDAVVVGAGIIGLTSALFLAQAGYRVIVVERESGACAVSSQANAGQLLYDRIGAMASPGFLRSTAKNLFNRDHGVQISGLLHPKRWPWAAAFARQCTDTAWQRNTQELLEIARKSRDAMTRITSMYSLDFDWRRPGKIVLYSTDAGLAAAGRTAEFQRQFGGEHDILNAAECIAREPALKASGRDFVGGVFLPNAEVGDCSKFGTALADILIKRLGVQIVYGAEVTELVREANTVRAIQTSQGLIEANTFVLATGGATEHLLGARFSGKKQVTGVKGVTLTYPCAQNAPDLSITDTAGKFVVLRLGSRVRVAGYAMFSDDRSVPRQLVRQLTDKARALMPGAAIYDRAPDVWVGFRPTTPDDLPMIGRMGPDNLYVNAGHGSLGWTLALGSAETLLNTIQSTARARPERSYKGYHLEKPEQ